MRLQQFLSSVFPRLSRTKSERNRQNNAADEKVVEQRKHLELSDLKYAFDAVDPASHGQGSSGLREGTARNDCGQPQSVRGGAGGVTEGEMHWVSEQFEDNRTGAAAVSRSRSMIRTNPWLASPKSQHNNEAMQSEEPAGPLSLHKSLPTTPTTSLVAGLKGTMDYRQALHARRELGLLLKVPGNLDDSSSEGYASSVFRSPSGTDLDSIEGCPDSALASSISSESDFDWGASLVPSYSPLCHAARTTSGCGKVGVGHRAAAVGKNEEVVGVVQFKTDDHSMKTTNSGKQELYSKKLQYTADLSVGKDKEDLVVKTKSIGIRVPPEHPRELKLVKCYSNSEHSSPKPVLQCSSHNQCDSPNRLEGIEQTDAPGPQISTQTNQNNTTAVEGDSEEAKEDEEKTELQNMNGGAIERSGSSRSLSEISESLQDKVRRLHEQKLYVDAIFHRAREEDQQRESQFAKFRSQFVAAKRQALLRKLQELQTMLGKQSTKLQVVYDAVLLVQWPKVFKVGEVKSN